MNKIEFKDFDEMKKTLNNICISMPKEGVKILSEIAVNKIKKEVADEEGAKSAKVEAGYNIKVKEKYNHYYSNMYEYVSNQDIIDRAIIQNKGDDL